MAKKKVDSASPEAVSAVTRVAANKAIRQLNRFETLVLAGAAVAAMAAGWITAFLLHRPLGLPFRTTWLASSFLLFVVPAAVAWGREARARRLLKRRLAALENPLEDSSPNGNEGHVE